jgi:hypothetical protein
MDDNKLTNEDWAVFFYTLFECVGNKEGLKAVLLPLAKAMDASGHMEEARKFLKAAVAEEG